MRSYPQRRTAIALLHIWSSHFNFARFLFLRFPDTPYCQPGDARFPAFRIQLGNAREIIAQPTRSNVPSLRGQRRNSPSHRWLPTPDRCPASSSHLFPAFITAEVPLQTAPPAQLHTSGMMFPNSPVTDS